MTRTNVYRDGELHVQARKCDTCIYRPGNLMHLEEGRKDRMQAEAVAAEGVIPCHKTLGTGREAICRGYFDVVKNEVQGLQLAERLEILVEDEEMLT